MKNLLLITFAISAFIACQNSDTNNSGTLAELEKSQSANTEANLSPEAQKGKQTFDICLACHNTELDSMLAPPMHMVQKRYKRSYPEKEAFIEKIAEHTKNPTEENSLMKMAYKTFGPMPPLPLSDEYLHAIGSYIYEAEFPFPCKHMKSEIDKDPESKHAMMMQKMVDENCE